MKRKKRYKKVHFRRIQSAYRHIQNAYEVLKNAYKAHTI
ncbi:hypothetical protein DJ46_5814 (plasmid) [Bacillus anthracis str. Vollum]|uniref:Uncharacterized protein n=1 Tax=Bacillus anthracis TaxID=1392 RepID=Q6F061_BACAN|nr:hypothetical protein BX_B0003 [Bacillus anthracis str. A2012]AAT28933.2 hypothetical protein GBAA_pXO2_0003 [Bacillus anthracis str. 'Ames Ancestor']AIK29667.1 hypothetical protein DJ48_5625 [Bacillus anthracis]AIK60773.1 hypothetical protein DJ46_5814 [Bacillus anthracis str. Vollum]EDR16307.1 hypothetical protein BAC_B0078 [Bacillus anthracis str. A0488]EDR85185.1 hypothetical protein BAQ_B0091 [Bacillus anthracis str. A0193]EDR90423.1 hypothetical protein BAH_B0032 [Bacillus anthracis s